MTDSLPKLEHLDAIVFDFDGVILESAAIKGHAFQELFAQVPEHLEAIRDHHLANLGVSRFQKFEWIYTNLLERQLAPAQSSQLGRRYSDLVLEKTAASPFVPGALEALESLKSRLPLFVASATPQEELEQIVERRDLAPFFVSVHGSPPAKAELLTAILNRWQFTSDRVLMIGDGVSDLQAAEHNGCRFLARIDERAPAQPFPASVPRVHTLEALTEMLC